MATIDTRRRRIDARIVYYGPGLSGKTTNLQNIHARLPAESRGNMQSIATEAERTLFFDFMPIQPIRLGGWDIRFHLYSVPGQEDYVRTRRALLAGADGIVFVADAAPDRLAANLASRDELLDHLRHYDKSLDALPVVVQVNKLDLPAVLDPVELGVKLALGNPPAIEAIALQGNGVAETLASITRRVAKAL
jgi:signal recognition particle receptor subunit beta